MGNFMNKLVRVEYKGCDADGVATFVTTDYRPLVIAACAIVATFGEYCLVNVVAPEIRKSIKNHKKNNEIIVESEEES